MINRKKCPDIRPFEEIDIQHPEKRTLPNGIPLNIIRAGTEEVVRTDILIHSGIWHQTTPLQALFTNRMLREGTNQMTSSQISERLDYFGAWLELTSSMNCNILTLYTLNKHIGQTLPIIAHLLKEPTFPEKELSVTLNSNKQQFLVNEQKVDIIARKAFSQTLFGNQHPCGRFAIAEDYERLTSSHLRDFYQKHYHSANCSIYVSGKVDEEIITLIETELGNEMWGTTRARTPLEPLPTKTSPEKRVFIEQPTAVQSALRIGSFSIPRSNKDFNKMRVLTTLLGGYFGSRLMTNIREEKGYTYGIGAGMIAYPHQSVMSIQTETSNEYVEPIIRETEKEIKRLQNDLVPQQELTMVQNYMLGEISRSFEGAFSLSDTWIFLETAGLDENFHTQTICDIQSVTREELRELAQKYWEIAELKEVVAGKKV